MLSIDAGSHSGKELDINVSFVVVAGINCRVKIMEIALSIHFSVFFNKRGVFF